MYTPAGEFELLDDVRDSLESVEIFVWSEVVVGDDEESSSLEKQHLVSVYYVSKCFQVRL